MSPSLPRVTTSTDCTSRYPMIIHSRKETLPGVSGLRLMPRKIAGIATMTIEASMVAIVMASVVLERATHL
jgi:hypothetical protein